MQSLKIMQVVKKNPGLVSMGPHRAMNNRSRCHLYSTPGLCEFNYGPDFGFFAPEFGIPKTLNLKVKLRFNEIFRHHFAFAFCGFRVPGRKNLAGIPCSGFRTGFKSSAQVCSTLTKLWWIFWRFYNEFLRVVKNFHFPLQPCQFGEILNRVDIRDIPLSWLHVIYPLRP